MKNALVSISILFLTACGGDNKSTERLIESENMEGLKAKRTELINQVKSAEEKIAQIDQALEADEKVEKLPLVSVYKVENQEFNHYLELQGSVETDQNIVVYAEVQGVLKDFKVKMGDRVTKGQTIAVIDDGGMSAQLAQVKQRADLSKTTYEKRKRLWEKNVGSEIDYLQAETQYKADEEAVKQMERQVAKATIKAPFSGLIDETIADEGQLVVPGQSPLFRIVNLTDMHIYADVPEKYLGRVQKGKVVWIDLPVLDTTLKSKITEVSNYINPDNRTFKVKIDVPSKGGLVKPNLTAKLKINDYSNKNALLVPQSLISEDSEGRQYVYSANATQGTDRATARKVFVTTGEKQAGIIEIVKGLMADDAIIDEGARTVREGQEVKIIK